jgi:hypothetical protein
LKHGFFCRAREHIVDFLFQLKFPVFIVCFALPRVQCHRLRARQRQKAELFVLDIYGRSLSLNNEGLCSLVFFTSLRPSVATLKGVFASRGYHLSYFVRGRLSRREHGHIPSVGLILRDDGAVSRISFYGIHEQTQAGSSKYKRHRGYPTRR